MFDYKKWRSERNLTIAAASRLIGVSSSKWSDIERLSEESVPIQRVLKAYDDGKWKDLSKVNVSPDMLNALAAENDRGLETLSFEIGCSFDHLKNMIRGKAIRDKYRISIASLYIQNKPDVTESTAESNSERYTYKWPGLDAFEAVVIKHNGNRTAIAEEMGVSRGTIYEWLSRHPHLESIGASKFDGKFSASSEQEPGGSQAKECDEEFVSNQSTQIIPYYFEGMKVNVIQADEKLMTFRQLGEALEYSDPYNSINQIVNAHIDELAEHLTTIDLIGVSGSKKKITVLREKGISTVTFFSQQPKAKVFRKYAANVIYNERRNQSSGGFNQDTMAQFAQLVGLRTQQIEAEAKAYTDRKMEEAAEVLSQQVSNILQQEKNSRLLVADKRRVIRENIAHIVRHIAGSHSPKWFARITNDLKESLSINKFDDIVDEYMANNALEWLRTEARRHGCILPAYQTPINLDGEQAV